MIERIKTMLLVFGALVAPLTVNAGNLAVIIANEDYRYYPKFSDVGSLLALQNSFEQSGFEVLAIKNLGARNVTKDLQKVSRRLAEADQVVVVLGGYVVSSKSDSWLLGVGADRPDTLTAGRNGISIGSFIEVLGNRPGSAMVSIAMRQSSVELSGSLTDGFMAPQNIPQGVTVVAARSDILPDFIENTVLAPEVPLAEGAARFDGSISLMGYVPYKRPFLLPNSGEVVVSLSPEEQLWKRAQNENTVEGYQLYLDLYPSGAFAAEAQKKVEDLTLTPIDRARIAEQELRLSRDARRKIQRDLTLIGYNTRGVDGLLGRNSRQAIARWQKDNGIPATGFLNANQISRIDSLAVVRAEQLRIQEEQRRREIERQDRDFWSRTGANGSERGLQDYLRRFPDGLYASIAQDRLNQIERQKRREAARAEREAWDRAVMTGTIESYAQYLNTYPRGKFASVARERINALQNPETPSDVVQAAKQEEASLNLNAVTRTLIEKRLEMLKFQPGRVDGKFTRDTRRAIRQFQRTAEMPVTGYVTKLLISRMLSQLPQR